MRLQQLVIGFLLATAGAFAAVVANVVGESNEGNNVAAGICVRVG